MQQFLLKSPSDKPSVRFLVSQNLHLISSSCFHHPLSMHLLAPITSPPLFPFYYYYSPRDIILVIAGKTSPLFFIYMKFIEHWTWCRPAQAACNFRWFIQTTECPGIFMNTGVAHESARNKLHAWPRTRRLPAVCTKFPSFHVHLSRHEFHPNESMAWKSEVRAYCVGTSGYRAPVIAKLLIRFGLGTGETCLPVLPLSSMGTRPRSDVTKRGSRLISSTGSNLSDYLPLG